MSVSEKDKRESLQCFLPNVSRETEDDFLAYEALVCKWQKHINLVANSTLPELWHRHIIDSLQLFALKPQAQSWLDIGSGGGFPGLVTAICLKNNGSGHISLIESNRKKAAFLQTVVAELSLPVTIHARRIEDCYDLIKTPDVITARALATLATLFQLTQPWFGKKTVGLLQKGRDYQLEIDEAHAQWRFDLLKHSSRIDDQSVILEIDHLEFCNSAA